MRQRDLDDRYGSYEKLRVDLEKVCAALSNSAVVEPQNSMASGEGDASGAAARSLPTWLVPAVALPLVSLGAFALLPGKCGPEMVLDK